VEALRKLGGERGFEEDKYIVNAAPKSGFVRLMQI